MTPRIAHGQIFCLICLYMLGSAWLFGLGAEAREAAWLALLAGLVAGLPLNGVYLLLQRRHPTLTLVEYIPAIVGRWLGKPLAFLYLLYFLYIAARVTRDFAELTVIAVLPTTPISVIAAVQVLLVMYAVWQGPEVLGRVAQVLLPTSLGLVLLSTLMVIPQFKWTSLLPLLGEGPQKILTAAFPLVVTVPFGEGVLFGQLYRDVRSGYRWGALGGAAAAGLALTYLSFVETGVLGSHLVGTSNFPLLELVRQINLGPMFERLDAAIVLVLTLGGFMKITLLLYGATFGLAQWLGLADYRRLVLPMGGLMLALSYAMARSFPEHVRIGLEQVPYWLHIPLQILLPAFLLIVAGIRHLLGGTRCLSG